MTAKRFKVVNLRDDSICDIQDTSQEILTFYNDLTYNFGSAKAICDLLNELHEEKEDWKHNCLITVSENSILWNEISILQEQGAEPSDAFKNYLNNLKNKNKKLEGDFE